MCCRFFYADERNADGSLKGKHLSGPAHAEFYAQLTEQNEKCPWRVTFVEGKGYVEFK